MRVINNGIAKEVVVLKHFKIANDEYILYKNTNSVSIGMVSDGKILAPQPDKLGVLMKILSNIISPTPIESINLANGCTMLSGIIEGSLEEVSFQNVNIPEAQLNALLTKPTTAVSNGVASPTPNSDEPKKEKTSDNRMKIYGIIIVVLIFVLLFVVFKDKIFKKGGSSPSPTPVPASTPAATDTTITELNMYELNEGDQVFYLNGNLVKLRVYNNQILYNDQEIVGYGDMAKAYVTNKFIILVDASQLDNFVKAINENGQVIEVTGIKSTPSEIIENLRIENGKLIADRSNENDPNVTGRKVEFVYDGNQITITEMA